jgi:hypothetical protein
MENRRGRKSAGYFGSPLATNSAFLLRRQLTFQDREKIEWIDLYEFNEPTKRFEIASGPVGHFTVEIELMENGYESMDNGAFFCLWRVPSGRRVYYRGESHSRSRSSDAQYLPVRPDIRCRTG